jgi:hypothetical protein
MTVAGGAAPAGAVTAGSHNPFGHVDSVSVVGGNSIRIVGWTADPDNVRYPLKVTAVIDGRAAATGTAELARPDVARSRGTGYRPGFSLTVRAANGIHRVCTVSKNIGAGVSIQLGCTNLVVGPPLMAAQIAARKPFGHVDTASGPSPTSIRVTGWAADPDDPARRLRVAVFVDGVGAGAVTTSIARADVARTRFAGPLTGFSITVPARNGTHNVCVVAFNIGLGGNTLIRCLSVSTARKPVAVAVPSANARIVAEAKKHLGSRYTWGGASPATGFDCSGLVLYSYRVAAGLVVPRVAQAQFKAARVISASRALPGDLVFFHDSKGAVYHVGIFVGGTRMYAAVDTATGVRIQTIWDIKATYGSFTHA